MASAPKRIKRKIGNLERGGGGTFPPKTPSSGRLMMVSGKKGKRGGSPSPGRQKGGRGRLSHPEKEGTSLLSIEKEDEDDKINLPLGKEEEPTALMERQLYSGASKT